MCKFILGKKVQLAFILSVLLLFTAPFSVLANSKVDIVVDPGHGGNDSGAALYGVTEKEVVLDIAKKLQGYLSGEGYKVALTRDKDVSLSGLSNVGDTLEKRDLHARVDIIDNSGAKFFISIHVNCDLQYTKGNGSIVYYDSKGSASKDLAYSIQNALNNITINNKRRMIHNPQSSNFYIINNTKIPGVLIETAFMSNKQERELLKTEGFRDEIAKAIVNGLENAKVAKTINVAPDNNYLAMAYSKDDCYANTKIFSTKQQGYDWIKGKTLDGLVCTATLPKKVFGVVLDGCIIDFSSNYVIKMEKGKSKYDDKVKALQKDLTVLGYKVTVDGYFGLSTQKAVQEFQKSVHLQPDGIVGKNAYESLVSAI